jgi:hypothetical protein
MFNEIFSGFSKFATPQRMLILIIFIVFLMAWALALALALAWALAWALALALLLPMRFHQNLLLIPMIFCPLTKTVNGLR